jgi:uncharacterized protein RhaS with RHS repeats
VDEISEVRAVLASALSRLVWSLDENRDSSQRRYGPGTGRFTQQDPIGFAGGLNLYGYAGGDPVNFSDPFGLCPVCLVAGAGSGVAVVLATPQAVATIAAGTALAAAATVTALDAASVLYEHTGRMLDWIDDGLHGNSKNSTRPTVGYTLRDADTGEVRKIGQTSRPDSRYSDRWLQGKNLIMRPEAVGSKGEMLAWEQEQLRRYKEAHDGNRPAENKVDRD